MERGIGSTWNKWDFHVHTPYSILNNGYGYNPFTQESEKLFDQYVHTLFTKAVEQNVMAIGITDYFLIDGYKRIIEDYLNNPTKMAVLFPEEELRQKIEQMYIFPNIELRLKTFVGKDARSVNYHVIFSNTIPIQQIEDNFLHLLKFNPDSKSTLPITKSNIEDFGRHIKQNNNESGSDLEIGLKHITVDDQDVLSMLSNDAFFKKYMIAIPVDETLSKISWNGRDYNIRKNLYEQSHCYMSSNQNTIDWALGRGKEKAEDIKREFGSLKPCIWGSDAHEYSQMFRPANNKFCWIKAELSFEGLYQILYEPAERVSIQESCPNAKSSHQIIKSIQFDDPNFQTGPIVFNDDLTCIIGGKSTGKSLLLQQIANSIDVSYAKAQESAAFLGRKNFPVQKTTVMWKDGTSDKRKIVYIPQTYLNRAIDKPEESTAITKIISDVLQQEPAISSAFSELESSLKYIRNQTLSDIANYCELVNKLQELENVIKEEGNSAVFGATLEKLEKDRAALACNVDLTLDKIDRYTQLEVLLADLEGRKSDYEKELSKIEALDSPVLVIPDFFSCPDGKNISHLFKDNFPHSNDSLQHAIIELTEEIRPKWKQICDNLVYDLSKTIAEIEEERSGLKEEYETLRLKIELSEKLQQISNLIAKEREKMRIAQEREENKANLIEKISSVQKNIIRSQIEYFSAYNKYCNTIRQTGTQKVTSLTFDATPVWKQKDFQSAISNLFDNRNFSSFRAESGYDLTLLDVNAYNEKLLNKLWTAMTDSQKSGALTIKTSYNIESALQLVFGDWYNIHYTVKSGEDTIEEMSPGKKALVLLELLISLENSKCPILIDQPEDDLDNRSIYEDLVQYIREKKHERQIIIVTHNANIVLGADAEEVIIANQRGTDTANVSRRFEYRSGAIENDEIGKDSQGTPLPGILNKQGIQTQICDILEGGRIAFELRQNKYMRHSRQ